VTPINGVEGEEGMTAPFCAPRRRLGRSSGTGKKGSDDDSSVWSQGSRRRRSYELTDGP
jgi:hypothetical protein